MPDTFNRRPFSVPTPSKNDVQDYFFTHSNFKGVNDNKNFLSVDQETFSDCKNVYVDSDGLLKSRPALKNVLLTEKEGSVSLNNILDMWGYGDVIVYKTNTHLFFENEKHNNLISTPLENDAKLILVENKIFIFEVDKMRYYDVQTHTISTAEQCLSDYLYIPVTKLCVNGIYQDLESPNELTGSHIIRYLYDNTYNINILIGKTVKLNIDDVEYTIDFKRDNEQVFVQKINNIPYNYSNVSVSSLGSFIICEPRGNTYDIYYTLDGKTFTTISLSQLPVSIPSISDDGTYICFAATDEIYAYKLLDDSGDEDLHAWIPLLQTIDNTKYTGWKERQLTFDKRSYVKMLSYDTFCTVGYLNINNELVGIVSHLGTLHMHSIRPTLHELNFSGLSFTDSISSINDEKAFDPILFTVPMTRDGETYSSVDIDLILRYRRGKLSGSITYKFIRIIDNIDLQRSVGIEALPLNVPGTTYINDFKVTFTDNGDGFTMDIQPNRLRRYFDFDYPFGSSYNCKIEDDVPYPANIDMLSTTDDYTVILNSGEYVLLYKEKPTIQSPLPRGVRFMGGTWNIPFEPQQYGLSINKTYVYYTMPIYGILYVYQRPINNLSILTRHYLLENGKSVVSKNGDVLTSKHLYRFSAASTPIPLLFESEPLYLGEDSLYLAKDGVIYTNLLKNVITIDEFKEGETKYIVPEHVSELSSFYMSVDKTLYISSYPSDGEFKWYFPKINTEQMDYHINNLHPISDTEMAVFSDDYVYYIQTSEQGYLYKKSKIQVGCKNGSDIITSYDGKYVIFPTERGLVALSYQDFVSSTEQVLSTLSDEIYVIYKDFGQCIKLLKYDFWILCYKKDSNDYLVFDIRNNSWWPMEVPNNISKIVKIKDNVYVICNGKVYEFKYDDVYYDIIDGNRNIIDWYLVSQKLHLKAPNYYKHISNITLISVLDSDEELYLDLILYNYRKRVHESQVESFKFTVDSIRTYVKRLNYSKVNEFQYRLTSNIDDAADEEENVTIPRVPLSLSSITTKYKISGQVR